MAGGLFPWLTADKALRPASPGALPRLWGPGLSLGETAPNCSGDGERASGLGMLQDV